MREIIEIPDAPSLPPHPQTTPQRPAMPPGFQPFSPSPPPTARSVSSARLPPNRRLNMDDHIPPAPSATASAPVSRYNPLTATVYTAEGRAEASDIFLNCCRLAAHHSTRFQLVEISTGDPIPSDSNIFVREPCRLFRTEILQPLQKNATSTAFLPSFQSFMEHLLHHARIDLVSVCNPNFFSGEFLIFCCRSNHGWCHHTCNQHRSRQGHSTYADSLLASATTLAWPRCYCPWRDCPLWTRNMWAY
jgi:hypothetical protein